LWSKQGQELINQNKQLAKIFLKNELGDKTKLWLWTFSECPEISTYIYNLCAGQYDVIKSTRSDAPTPMRIFVRNSKRDFVDADLVFRVLT